LASTSHRSSWQCVAAQARPLPSAFNRLPQFPLAPSGSGEEVISAIGRFIAFGSNASNLVPGDTNGTFDVFVHDRLGERPSG